MPLPGAPVPPRVRSPGTALLGGVGEVTYAAGPTQDIQEVPHTGGERCFWLSARTASCIELVLSI